MYFESKNVLNPSKITILYYRAGLGLDCSHLTDGFSILHFHME
jgi:hypothetical protein